MRGELLILALMGLMSMDLSETVPKNFQEHMNALKSRMAEPISEADLNHDGKLQFNEFLDRNWKTISLYSKNPDQVSLTEFLEAFHGPASDPISKKYIESASSDKYKALFHELDKSGKGFITKDDSAPYVRRLFDAADANHDGGITNSELHNRR